MAQFKEIKPEDLAANAFRMIGKDWMLVTAEKDGKANTMTASWGGLGVMWGKNVALVVIRPQRFTKEFVDASSTLSLSFLDETYRKQLGYLGSVSGRDENKIKQAGLTLAYNGATPFFEEAQTVLICRKLYAQAMQAECFIDQDAMRQWYPDADYHTAYIVEIEKVLQK